MARLRELIQEIHRRSLWQVTGIFMAASWVVLQVVETLTESAGLPDWTPSMALVLLLVGLPICLATAFVQEGMPGQDGERATDSMSPGEPGSSEPGAPAHTTVAPENLAAGTGSLDRPNRRPSGTRKLLTWKNAVLGGVGAFALLGFSLITYFVMWETGIGPVGNLVAQGVIEEGDRIVLADFEDATNEGLGDVVTEALRVDLTEAEVFRLAEAADLEPTLLRMQLEPGAPLTPDLALEVAVRDGMAGVIDGAVSAAGSGYVITATLRAADTGRALATFRSTADGPEEVIESIDKLSQDLREKSGESLRTIKSGEPLEKVTTASLDALRLYSEADRIFGTTEELRTIELLEEAVAIDPQFAMAWRKLAAAVNNGSERDPQRELEAATRAYENRDRLTETERYLAEAYYYGQVQNDQPATIAAYQAILRVNPDHPAALNNLANAYNAVGDRVRGIELRRRAVSGLGRTTTAFSNLVLDELTLGEYERASAVLDEYEVAYPTGANIPAGRFHVLLMSGAASRAVDFAESRLNDPTLTPFDRAEAARWLTKVAYREGRFADAHSWAERAARIASQDGSTLETETLFWGAFGATMLGDPREARDPVRSLAQSEGFATTSIPFKAVAIFLAAATGDEDLTITVRERAGAIPDDDPWTLRMNVLARASLGDTVGTISEMDAIREEAGCLGEYCWLLERASVAELSGDAARSIPIQEVRARTGGGGAWGMIGTTDVHATLRLGPLYEQVGDTANAIAAYREIISLWENGDATAQAVVSRARERVQALGG